MLSPCYKIAGTSTKCIQSWDTYNNHDVLYFIYLVYINVVDLFFSLVLYDMVKYNNRVS